MNEKHATRLRDEIEDDIATGRIRPGERLDEVSLAARFGVSRTPIREALHNLAASGLIEIRPHRGAIVTDVPPHRLVEMFDVMAELEAMSSRLAARRLLPEGRVAILEAYAACSQAAEENDTDAYYYENERFHCAIYAAGGNSFLCEQAIGLSRRLKPFRRLQLRVGARVRASLEEHKRILDAILAGDSEAAAREAHAHVVIQGERFGDLVASLSAARSSAA